MPMVTPPNVYRCRACASTSYAKLTERGPDGVMRYSGVYRCSGCAFTFTDPADWRERRLRPRVRAAGANPALSGGMPEEVANE
jgi:hypothetical protein